MAAAHRRSELRHIEDDMGRLVKMRSYDGLHFERPAGDLIARRVLERISQRLDFTSWRDG